ncbi:MAG: phenylalanine--tRNA ligase subunit beta [Candidatus Zixiibacteriota bacterium]|nr:MAG: phenylalanine--tRNA ligase subunit beta [candidate division Zixibacteria bacterium]
MKVSYHWLKELTGLDWPVEEMAERLTLCGTACEDIVSTSRYLDRVVVGEVLELHPVPGADKIRRAVTAIGSENLDIICGAPNVAAGQKVPVALIGAKLDSGFEVKKVKIKGVTSCGMICSQAELGISDDHSGIWVLDDDATVGKPLAECLDYDDYILDFELTPDRADSMSAIGIARDLAALASVKIRYPSFDLEESAESAADHIQVSIADEEACPRFTARIIRDVTIGPSPWWLQKKLLSCGMRPISNVVDITNLVMLETGNPVHAFDLDRFGSDEVLVRRAVEGEKMTTLDGKEHTLTPDVLLITNGKEGKAAAGVMGGEDSEVSSETRNILLEVAYFSPSVIRKSRRHLGIISEASSRFEKGVDPNNVPGASARVAHLFHDVCGGSVLKGVVDCYPKRIDPVTVSFRPDRCNKVLGTDIRPERMKQIFADLEFEVDGSDPMKVTAPTFRHDINLEIDLIEEVARVEGYDSIPDAQENIGPLFTPTHEEDVFEDEVRRMMTGAGFDEMISHGLVHSRQAAIIDSGLPYLKIVNPVSEDLDMMRNSLVHTGLIAVNHNVAHRNMDLRLFEIGKAYFPPDPDGLWLEDNRLMILVTGNSPASWRNASRPFDFYDVTGAIESMGEHFGWPSLRFEAETAPYYEEEVSFSIRCGDTEIGTIGQITETILKKFDIKQPVHIAELKISDLIKLSRDLSEFEPLPIYPAAPRDLALVVNETVQVGQVLERIRSVAGDMAETVDVFDYYKGKQIAEGMKSVGIAIVFRLKHRSLASQEIDKVQLDIIEMLQREFKAEIRTK